MGEALYIHFLYVATKNSTNEQNRINTVLSWSSLANVAIAENLVAGLTPGTPARDPCFTPASVPGWFPFRIRRATKGARAG